MQSNLLRQFDAAKGYSDTRYIVHIVSVKLFSEVRLAFINVVSPTAVRTQI